MSRMRKFSFHNCLCELRVHKYILSIPLPEIFRGQYLRIEGDLCLTLANAHAHPRDRIWVWAHKDLAKNSRVRVLMEFLMKAFAKHKDPIEGRGMAAL